MRLIGLLISVAIVAVGGYYILLLLGEGESDESGSASVEHTIFISREATRHSHMISISTAINLAVTEKEQFNSVADVVLACSDASSVDDLGEGRLFEIDLFACGLSSNEVEDPLGGRYRIEIVGASDKIVRLYASQSAVESEFYSNPRVF